MTATQNSLRRIATSSPAPSADSHRLRADRVRLQGQGSAAERRLPAFLATPFLAALTVMGALAGAPQAAAEQGYIVYSSDFTGGALGVVWSHPVTSIAPSGEEFLGEFGNDRVQFTLAALPPHTRLKLSFDLYIIRSWDGNTATNGEGPDEWRLGYAMTATPLTQEVLLDTTFSNYATRAQAYPGSFPDGNHAARTAAQAINTLGYDTALEGGDTTYHFEARVDHVGSVAQFVFSGLGLEPLPNESWGIDNVLVTALLPEANVPVPASETHVYSNDFSQNAGAEWSLRRNGASPSGETFLGEFGNDAVTLQLAGLPDHTGLRMAFDLYVIRSWDGNMVPALDCGLLDCVTNGEGPDLWRLEASSGVSLVETTFSNYGDRSQSYPAPYPYLHAARSGSARQNTLGYEAADQGGDTTYRVVADVAHDGDAVEFHFQALNLESLDDESWGIDNVEVNALIAQL